MYTMHNIVIIYGQSKVERLIIILLLDTSNNEIINSIHDDIIFKSDIIKQFMMAVV